MTWLTVCYWILTLCSLCAINPCIATDPTKLKSKKLSTFKTDSKGRLLIIDDDQTMSVDVDNAPTDDCNMEVDEPVCLVYS